ncbi:MAG: hypothetical protein AAGE52_09320 [Myxococcota bacterium]
MGSPRLRFALVAVFVCACGSRETAPSAQSTETPTSAAPASATPTSETPTAETPTSETPTSETRSAPSVDGHTALRSCEVGYVHPFTPTRAHLRASRAALRLHRQEAFAEAATAFRALSESAPTYGSARFNLACAALRAGDAETARREIGRLLCEDLPTNLPRALADEDLAPIRAEIARLGEMLIERYEAASENGARLVAFGVTADEDPEASLHWTQAGFWTGERFVPASPRRQGRAAPRRQGPPLYASVIHEGQVVEVHSIVSWAEMAFLPRFEVKLLERFRGRELFTRHVNREQSDFIALRVGFEDARPFLTYLPYNEAPSRTEWAETGARAAPVAKPQIGIGPSTWIPVSNDELVARGRTLRDGDRRIRLDRRHRRDVRITRIDHWAVVHSSSTGDCGFPDRYFTEVIDLRRGTAVWGEGGEGQRLFHVEQGKLWMQDLERLVWFPDPGAPARRELPTGFGISSAFESFNSMC